VFRACLLSLLLYVAIAVGYFFWLDTVFEPPGNYWGAAGLGFVVFLCVGALMNARTAWKDWTLAAAARANAPPRHGRLFAACGTIEPVGEPVIAPFSQVPCCLVEYDLRQAENAPAQRDVKTGSDLAGFLMTPSEIHTPTGRFKLLGFPTIDEEEAYTLDSFVAARNARDFVTRTEFEDLSGLRVVNAISALQDAWTDEDGRVEKNLQLKKVDPQALFPDDLEAAWQEFHSQKPVSQSPTNNRVEASADDDGDDESPIPLPMLKEKRVAPGDKVCIIGKYDELSRGIRPAGVGLKAIRLIRGDVETLERRSRSSLWSYLVGGVVFLLLAHGVTFGIMQLYLHSPDTLRKRATTAFHAAQLGEIEPIERLVKRGMDINIRDSNGYTLLMVTRDSTLARWLIDRKIDLNAVDHLGNTALAHFAVSNQRDLVELLIASGADLNVQNRSGRTAMELAEASFHLEIADVLRQAGAEDHIITAKNGQPLPDDGGPQLAVAKQCVRAILAKDAQLLADSVVNPHREIDDSLWRSWQHEVFEPFERFEGYARGDRATLNVYGKSAAYNFAPARIEFLLRRVNGQWKVADRRFYIN
jgi:hypothetical protein